MNSDVIEENPKHRQSLLRRAAYLVPAAVVTMGGFLWALTWLPQSIIGVFFMGIIAIPLSLEAVGVVRDLRAHPVTTEGHIERMWTKSRFAFLGKVTYVLVEKKLFELSPVAGMELRLGDDVRIEHWPHSHALVRLTRVASSKLR
jgi:hypothetical protein